MPDGSEIILAPQAVEMDETEEVRWSSQSRAAWLRGKRAPSPADLFRRLRDRIDHYVEVARDVAETIALWVMLTFFYCVFPAVPYLLVFGSKGSGKSRLLGVQEKLVFGPLVTSNATGPAIFRTLHQRGGTLLHDEAEALGADHAADLRSVLLAGYKQGGRATRLIKDGDDFRFQSFAVFGPKVLVCIHFHKLPDALASRGIQIVMIRAPVGSPKPRRRLDDDTKGWQDLRDDLHVMALEYGRTLLKLSSVSRVCPPMSGREYELWQPLLAIASWIESHGERGLLARMQAHATDTAELSRYGVFEEAGVTILQALADAARAGDRPTALEILAAAQEKRAIMLLRWTPLQVANVLKGYGIPKPTKSGGRREYRVTFEQVRKIATRHGIDVRG
jgi:hypothetical protein